MGVEMTKPSCPRSKTNTWTDDQCTVDGAQAFMLRMSSIFGLAPLRFKPHGDGYIVSISVPMCIYSYIMITGLIALTLFGLISELNQGIRPYAHMSSRLSQFISCIDVLMITILASVGVYGAPCRMRNMIKFMNVIASVDKRIGYQYSLWWNRRLCAGVCLFILWFSFIHITDIYYYTYHASIFNSHWELVAHYLGLYILWFPVMILKIQFTITVMVVYSRFKAVEEALSVTTKLLVEIYMEEEKDPDANIFMTRISPNDKGTQKTQKIKTSFIRPPVTGNGDRLHPSPCDVIQRISSQLVDLCDMTRLIVNNYSTVLVLKLMLNVFHLVVSPYFAIIEIQLRAPNSPWGHYMILQCAWYTIHILRLFLVVEPCYYTIAKIREIENLVCRLVVTAPNTGALAIHVEHLALQLMVQPVCFKPKGLCTLDRPLIASIFGAVTTYLVILIQFQKYDN
nr:gustatory receptor for sugar taste 43a-like [Plodia interpunctella]